MTQFVRLDTFPEYAIISFQGVSNLDANSALRVKAEMKGLIDEQVSNVLIDLSNVSFIDSTGFGTLISVLKTIKNKNGKLILVGVSPEVQELMDLMQLLNVFELAPDTKSALVQLNA